MISVSLLPKAVRQTLLALIFLNAATLIQAATEPFNAGQDDLAEMDFVAQLEDRLTRDLRSYLGHERFIVNIDARVQKVRGVIPQATPAYQLSPRQEQKLQDLDQLIGRLEQQTRDQQVASRPATLQLPGLPFGEEATVEVPDREVSSPQLDSLRELREQLVQFQEPEITEEVLHTSQDVIAQIDNMVVTLLVDEKISPAQENFIKNLLENKLDLDYFRGDKLAILKTPFEYLDQALDGNVEDQNTPPAVDNLPEPAEPVTEPEEEEEKSWLERYFPHLLLGLLVLMILLLAVQLFRRQQVIHQPAPHPVVPPSANQNAEMLETNKVDSEAKYDLRSLKQDIITAGLGAPDRASARVDDLLMGGQYLRPLAAAYQVLGASLFRGLFPSVSTGQVYEIIEFLEQNSFGPAELHHELSELKKQLYQNQELNGHQHPSKPFKFLERLSDSQITYLLQDEEPRIKALVLSQVSASRAASLLKQLAPAQQGLVAYEIGQFNDFPMATFRDVADRLAKKSLNVPSFENLNTDGTTLLIDMLDNLPSADEHQLLDRIKTESPETYYRLRQVYYTFSDIGRTPPDILAEALRELDRKQLATALNNADPELVKYTLDALPSKLRAAIQDELQFTETSPAESAIDQARRTIVHHIRSLIKIGKFSMEDLATIE